jgi:argininosuccinate lyase
MAAIEFLERDLERLQAAYARVNRSPLGACAITTTGFPIDRNLTAELLGFQGLQLNSYGAIAAVDYLTESCAALAVSMVNLGKLAQDLLQWSTVEFGFIRLSDGYVQISSIMPQKRNPVPLEHVRILSSRALTQAHGVILSLHNTPFTDINDGEDDLQPLAYTAFADAMRSLRLFTGLLSEIELDTDRMAASAHQHFLTVTELADVLVRSTGMDFRAAHEIVSEAVRASYGDDSPETMVRLVATELDHRGLSGRITPQDLRNSLDPAHFVAVRRIPGGPAPEALEPALYDSQRLYAQHLEWHNRARTHLVSAEQELLHRAATLTAL